PPTSSTLFPYTTLFRSGQVSGQHTANPGQPQGVWLLLHLRQAFHLDPDDAGRRSRRTANMQVIPGVDVDVAINGMLKVRRLPRRSEEHTSELQSLAYLV